MEVDRRRNSTSIKRPIKQSKEAITSGWWRRCCSGMSAECMDLFQLEQNMEGCVSKWDERKREDIYEGCVHLYRRMCCEYIHKRHKSHVNYFWCCSSVCGSTNYVRLNALFWDVAPCRYFVNWRFGGTYRLHLQGIRNPRAMNQREQVTLDWVSVRYTKLCKNRKGMERGHMGNQYKWQTIMSKSVDLRFPRR
jgi:hypothetical protein